MWERKDIVLVCLTFLTFKMQYIFFNIYFLPTYIHIYIYIYLFIICVCLCVYFLPFTNKLGTKDDCK